MFRIWVILIFFGVFNTNLNSPAYGDDRCARAIVESGGTCNNLQIIFDFSQCGRGQSKKVKSVCHSGNRGTAIAKVIENQRLWIAEFVHSGNIWVTDSAESKKNLGSVGSSFDWTFVSIHSEKISRKKDLEKLKKQSIRVSLQKPNRSPAGNIPMFPSSAPIPIQPDVGLHAFTFSAYFDVYYLYNFNQPAAVAAPNLSSVGSAALRPGNDTLRFYDGYSNQLALNLVELTIKHTRVETSLYVDLDFGQFADLNSIFVSSDGNVIDEVSKNLGQAIFTYNPSSISGLTIDFGKMYTHIGLETPKPKDNWAYSRTLSFSYGSPFWHEGIHVGYSFVPDKLKANFYLYKGWNTIYAFNNGMPTIGFQLNWTPTDKTVMNLNYIGGVEQPNNTSNVKQAIDVNVIHRFDSFFAIALDGMFGRENGVLLNQSISNVSWAGTQVSGKWQFTQNYYFSSRFEIYSDPHGYTLGGEPQNVYSTTFTNSFKLTDGFETRFELRNDASTSKQTFQTGDGKSNHQNTATLSILYTI